MKYFMILLVIVLFAFESLFYIQMLQQNSYNEKNRFLKFTLKNIKENINLFKDKIIISDEISSGIVPLKKEDRMWREETGRCLQYLSKESSCVYRVFCGISTIIKS